MRQGLIGPLRPASGSSPREHSCQRCRSSSPRAVSPPADRALPLLLSDSWGHATASSGVAAPGRSAVVHQPAQLTIAVVAKLSCDAGTAGPLVRRRSDRAAWRGGRPRGVIRADARSSDVSGVRAKTGQEVTARAG